jgi:hypothetical protein
MNPKRWIHVYCILFLFSYNVFNNAVSNSDHIASSDGIIIDNKLKKCGRKRSWHNFKLYLRICLEELGKTTTCLSKNIACPDRDSNRTRLEFKPVIA